ncbi:acylphosphatase [Salisediminibacterium halotolerans]|uniref:acylphosphatase n=1 Tax=Salisediminibacterium halotolerans TaxID=517425 RepID=A0A1H9TX43_9BACI|nr:acylphosphatase [Salisediminibacterium haloalkalitolerans]SES01601.1 D-alanine-D-alanine ligase [Salisediminibacterium haloalkalitolerans]
MTNYTWLPHLDGAVPPAGQGKRISTYTVALEAWRRGIRLRFYSTFDEENKLKLRYALKHDEKEHHFALSKGDEVTEEAFDICEDKQLTREYLEEAGVAVPKGAKFADGTTEDEIIRFAESIGYPVVLKPVSANGGKGVFANVKDEEVLRGAIQYVRDELEYKDVIIEEHIPWEREFRIIVIGDRVLGAMHRIPANVQGDGVQTIKQLIEEKNKFRKQNPHLTNRTIRIDKEVLYMIEQAGYTLDSVLEEGKTLYLRVQSNLSNGGDSVDMTEELSPGLEQMALDATKAIPGLAQSGVDIMVDDHGEQGVVVEVNSRPGLGGHLFPMHGTPRDFAKAFIDYYFPETADYHRSNLYFNFDAILEPLKARSASMVEVARAPAGKMYARKFIVKGDVQGIGYRQHIKREALNNQFHGFAKNEADGSVSVVVTGEDEEQVEAFREICAEGPENANVHEVQVEPWTKPLCIGFKSLSVKKKTLTKKDYERMARHYLMMQKSTSWKITAPIRKAMDVVKKIKRKQ